MELQYATSQQRPATELHTVVGVGQPAAPRVQSLDRNRDKEKANRQYPNAAVSDAWKLSHRRNLFQPSDRDLKRTQLRRCRRLTSAVYRRRVAPTAAQRASVLKGFGRKRVDRRG